jgi:hypothetical protein
MAEDKMSTAESLRSTRTYGQVRCHNPSCTARITPPPGLKMVKCERCMEIVDTRTAYHRIERYGNGQVNAYYCDHCRALLGQVGIGEHTAMDERATEIKDNAPEIKE